MIRINLLPVKAARKHDTARNELLVMVAAVGVVAALLMGWWWSLEASIAGADERIQQVNREIELLKQEVVRIKDFEKKTKTLEKKLGIIEDLKRRRTGPARLLDNLATIMNDEEQVWLTGLTEKGGAMTLEGGAMEHENISDFQMALSRSKYFTGVKLAFVETGKSAKTPYLRWKILCTANYSAG